MTCSRIPLAPFFKFPGDVRVLGSTTSPSGFSTCVSCRHGANPAEGSFYAGATGPSPSTPGDAVGAGPVARFRKVGSRVPRKSSPRPAVSRAHQTRPSTEPLRSLLEHRPAAGACRRTWGRGPGPGLDRRFKCSHLRTGRPKFLPRARRDGVRGASSRTCYAARVCRSGPEPARRRGRIARSRHRGPCCSRGSRRKPRASLGTPLTRWLRVAAAFAFFCRRGSSFDPEKEVLARPITFPPRRAELDFPLLEAVLPLCRPGRRT